MARQNGSRKTNHKTTYDIAIIGGGLAGITFAITMARKGISTCLIESKPTEKLIDSSADGRASAIAYDGKEFFDTIGVWNELKKYAGPILDIRITDNNSHLFLHYEHNLVSNDPMGYIIENYNILKTLYKKAISIKNLHIISGNSYAKISTEKESKEIELENGKLISAKLLIAADGKQSKIRSIEKIDSQVFDYKQTAIVCNIKHEKKHKGLAVENFLPSGPFACLPMQSEYHSSLVWTEKASLVEHYLKLDDDKILEQIQSRLGGFLGKIEMASKVFTYPLYLVHAKSYISERTALIGDAAHGIHPIAGQGFNLAIRDIRELSNILFKYKTLGYDIGSSLVLEEYSKIRKFDVMSMISVTDLLNRLFSNNHLPIKLARQLGLAVVQKTTPLKKFFMKHAMGIR